MELWRRLSDFCTETTGTPNAMSMHIDMGHSTAISESRHGGLCSVDHGPHGG
jgi:hypothetical protein